MEAGASTTVAARTDIFDRIGDLLGNAARTETQRLVDRTTVLSPLVGITRSIVDPAGAKASYARVGKEALDAASVLVPGVGAARAAGSYISKHPDEAARAAKTGFNLLTVTNPLVAWGRGLAAAFR